MAELARQFIDAPRLLLDETFDNLDTMAIALGWDVEFRQTEPGEMRGETTLVGNGSTMIQRVSFNRSFHQRGTPPSGLTCFGLVDTNSGEMRVQRYEAPPGCLVNFNTPVGLDSTTTNAFSGHVIGFAPSTLELARDVMHLEIDIGAALSEQPFWNPDRVDQGVLRRLVAQVWEHWETEGEPGLMDCDEIFEFELPMAVLNVVAGPQEHMQPAQPHSRERALRQALDLLEAPENADITVSSLCKACHVSWATLERAFMDEFGIAPKAYIRSRRLAAVNKQLVRSPTDTRISDVANEWGFWHMGAFAADYRKQFGELPSDTLKRPANGAA